MCARHMPLAPSAPHRRCARLPPAVRSRLPPAPLSGCRIRESTLVRLLSSLRRSAFIDRYRYISYLLSLGFLVKSFAWTHGILGSGAPSLFLSKRRDVSPPFFLLGARLLAYRFNCVCLYLLHSSVIAIRFNLRPLRISPLGTSQHFSRLIR